MKRDQIAWSLIKLCLGIFVLLALLVAFRDQSPSVLLESFQRIWNMMSTVVVFALGCIFGVRGKI